MKKNRFSVRNILFIRFCLFSHLLVCSVGFDNTKIDNKINDDKTKQVHHDDLTNEILVNLRIVKK